MTIENARPTIVSNAVPLQRPSDRREICGVFERDRGLITEILPTPSSVSSTVHGTAWGF